MKNPKQHIAVYPIWFIIPLIICACAVSHAQEAEAFAMKGCSEAGGSISFQSVSPVVNGVSGAAIVIASAKTYSWNRGADGWEGTNDFRLDSTFSKLGGPLDGNAWITECPRKPQTYTAGAYADTEGYCIGSEPTGQMRGRI